VSYRERLRRRSCDRRSPGVGRATCTHASSGRIERAVLTCRGAYAMHNLSSMRHEIWAARAPGSKTVRAHVKGGGQQPKSRQFGLLFSVQMGIWSQNPLCRGCRRTHLGSAPQCMRISSPVSPAVTRADVVTTITIYCRRSAAGAFTCCIGGKPRRVCQRYVFFFFFCKPPTSRSFPIGATRSYVPKIQQTDGTRASVCRTATARPPFGPEQ
jgi:hypothetical protein